VASTLASVLASDCEPLSWVAALSRRLAARRAERWRAAWERLGFLLWERHAERPLRRRREARQAPCERRCRLAPARVAVVALAVGAAERAERAGRSGCAAAVSRTAPEQMHAKIAVVVPSSVRRLLTSPISADGRAY